jgi:shikimate dehydrogenase
VKLAVLGDPLAFTRSPELHRAGLAELGIDCESRAVRTPLDQLAERLRELAAEGYAGVNLTHPLKEAALDHVRRVSEPARVSRSINTIGFGADGAWGETTDGLGFVDLLRTLGRDPGAERMLIFGAGGAARSLTLALQAAGVASLKVATRDPARSAPSWAAIGGTPLVATLGAEVSNELGRATLIVNATPCSSASEPVTPAATLADALLIDLTYGPEPTPWVSAARDSRRRAIDGLGLLVHQARHSIMRWTGRELAVEPLARAVGWRP